MDELQISGKRFISSRRIAKENGYHTDYIGQLIRGGKIKGQKVGRTWYVDELSFATYLGETPESVSAQPVIEDKVEPVVESVLVEEEKEEVAEKIIEVEQKDIEEAPVVISVVEEKKVITEEPAPTPIVVTVDKKTIPVISGGLKYIVDDEPLLPEISPIIEAPRATPVQITAQQEVKEKPQAVVVMYRPSARRAVGVLAVVGVTVFIFSAVVSSTVFQTINIQEGNSASVGYSFHW